MPPKPSDEPRTARHNFNMTPKLKALLVEARKANGESMTGEMHSRLEASFNDPTQRIAVAIWPLIQRLNQDDQAKFVELIAEMARAKRT